MYITLYEKKEIQIAMYARMRKLPKHLAAHIIKIVYRFINEHEMVIMRKLPKHLAANKMRLSFAMYARSKCGYPQNAAILFFLPIENQCDIQYFVQANAHENVVEESMRKMPLENHSGLRHTHD